MQEIELYRYPNPTDEAVHLSIKTMEGIYDQTQGAVDHPHRHDYYTILWVREGTGQHLIDFNTYPLEPNAVFFVSPGQIHQVVTDNRPRGWVITFSKSFLQQNHVSESFIQEINLFNSFEERPPLFLTERVVDQLEGLLQGMAELYQSDYRHRLAGAGAYLKLFLVYCEEECTAGPDAFRSPHPGKTLLREFKELVAERFQELHGVGDYAKLLGVSPKHLNQVVKALLGQTAKAVIQEKIILNARRELRYSDLSVKEIAYKLGFEEPLYFSTVFKKATGQSPTEFRAQ